MALAEPAVALADVGRQPGAKGASHELVEGGPQAAALRADAFDVQGFLRAGLGRGFVEFVGVGAIVRFVPRSVEEYGKILHHDRLPTDRVFRYLCCRLGPRLRDARYHARLCGEAAWFPC
ncbi:hypothetical protein D3C85_1508660 [compost metagenome]